MTRQRWLMMTLLGLLLITALFLWQRPRSVADAAPLLRPGDDAVLARGAAVYMQHCASCHGARGEGQPNWRERGLDGLLPAPPHDASGHTWHHPDAQLFAITKFGLARIINQPAYQTAMPVYEGILSDDDFAAVLSWIKAQWPPEVRTHHDRINTQAAAVTR